MTAGAPVALSRDRFNIKGPVAAGDYLRGSDHCTPEGCIYEQCTAAYSADNQVGVVRGQPVFAFYKLTAGHCFGPNEQVYRRSQREGGDVKSVGTVAGRLWVARGLECDSAVVITEAPPAPLHQCLQLGRHGSGGHQRSSAWLLTDTTGTLIGRSLRSHSVLI